MIFLAIHYQKDQLSQVSFIQLSKEVHKCHDYDTLFNSNLVNKQQSIIHYLCKNNHYYIFDAIDKQLKHDIDINCRDKNGETPLTIALHEKCT
jgi:ankyrin repeat protein